MKLKNHPWWHEVTQKCPHCGGSFELEADDYVKKSTKQRAREDNYNNRGALGTQWSGIVSCPYCKLESLVSTFTSM